MRGGFDLTDLAISYAKAGAKRSHLRFAIAAGIRCYYIKHRITGTRNDLVRRAFSVAKWERIMKFTEKDNGW
jgi:hypothetical protein